MSTPYSELQLFIKCRNLPKLDVTSNSDPSLRSSDISVFFNVYSVVVVSLKDTRTGGVFREIGRTEWVKNSCDPNFTTEIELPYFFEELQTIHFDFYDVDNPKNPDKDHDVIGSIETSVGQIVGCNSGKPFEIRHPSHSHARGVAIFVAEEKSSSRGTFKFQFSASHLDKKDFFGKSDPFFVLSRQNPDGSHSSFFKSDVIKVNLNPVWKPSIASLTEFCNGNFDRSIKIEVFDWDADGSHDFIGSATTTAAALVGGAKSFELISEKKKIANKKYQNSGVLNVLSFEFIKELSFIEHLKAGLELNFSVAVDFTGSNGDPKLASSLHYINPYQPNSYYLAISAVGSVIQDYDADKLFPGLGFGAKLADGTVSHLFSLTGNMQNPYCAGIPGVLQAYAATLGVVQLWGPTNFAPLISYTASIAAAAKADAGKFGFANCLRNDLISSLRPKYFVLLIVTDGVITDMPDTIKAIVEATFLPLSIIIVGVGQADFAGMNALDGDGGALKYGSKTACRDIVQFVPMRDFFGKDPSFLTKEVLAEVPAQVCQYFTLFPKK